MRSDCASSSMSSTSRPMRAISARTSRSTRRTSSRRDLVGRREHLELPADDRQRRAQLVRGVGDELALGGKGIGEAIEHAVEGLREDLHLVLAAAVALHARLEVAPVDARGHGGHAPQRGRHAGAGHVGGEQGQREHEDAGEQEGPGHAALGPSDDRERLADADAHRDAGTDGGGALEQAYVARRRAAAV